MIKKIKDFYIQETIEPLGLQILKSALITKKPVKVIENAQEMLAKRKKTKLVSKLEEIKHLVATQGQDLFEVLNIYKFISDSTYEELKTITNLTKLEAEHIDTFIKMKEEEKELKRRLQKIITSNYFIIFISALVVVYMIKNFKPFIIKYMNNSMLYDFYYKLANLEILEQLILSLIISFFFIMLLKIIVNLYISGKQEFFKFISIIKLLRQSGLSYLKIFENLLNKKYNNKIIRISSEIYDKLQVETPAKSLVSITDNLPLADAIIFIDRIETGDDLYAWNQLSNKIYEEVEDKIEKFKPVIDLLIKIFVLILMSIGMLPMIYGISNIISKI